MLSHQQNLLYARPIAIFCHLTDCVTQREAADDTDRPVSPPSPIVTSFALPDHSSVEAIAPSQTCLLSDIAEAEEPDGPEDAAEVSAGGSTCLQAGSTGGLSFSSFGSSYHSFPRLAIVSEVPVAPSRTSSPSPHVGDPIPPYAANTEEFAVRLLSPALTPVIESASSAPWSHIERSLSPTPATLATDETATQSPSTLLASTLSPQYAPPVDIRQPIASDTALVTDAALASDNSVPSPHPQAAQSLAHVEDAIANVVSEVVTSVTEGVVDAKRLAQGTHVSVAIFSG